MNNRTLQLLQAGNLIAVILTIIVNGLANILPIGGKYTGELSDNIPNLFVPAGITFAIWGVIYVLIIVFAVYLAKDLLKKEKTTKHLIEKISFFFIIASLSNIIWIFLWHYEQVLLSLLAMLLLFFFANAEASSAFALKTKTSLTGGRVVLIVELRGVEPRSKRETHMLSTCLVYLRFS